MKSLLDLFEEISCKKKRRWINSSYEKLPSSIKNLMNSYKLEIYLITNKEMDALTNDKGVLGLYLNKETANLFKRSSKQIRFNKLFLSRIRAFY